MKFDIKIDLEWLNDEQSIDSAVKEEIVDKVVANIGNKITLLIEKEAKNKINYSIDKYIDDLLRNFLDREFVVTDRYGDVKARYSNVDEMLKEKFDAFMTHPVDSKGSATTACSYKDSDRLSFMITTLANKHKDSWEKTMQKVADGVATNLHKLIAEQTNEKILKTVAEKIFSKIDLENIK